MKYPVLAIIAVLSAAPAFASGPTTMNYEYYRRCSDTSKPADQRIVECGRAMAFEKTFGVKAQYALYVDRGLAFFEKGDFDHALADLNMAVTLDDRPYVALINRAYVYRAQGKPGDAMADLDRAVELEPSRPSAFSARALVEADEGNIDFALKDLATAIEAAPDQGMLYQRRCLVRARGASDLSAAFADCDKALKLEPKNTGFLDTRALVRLKMSDYAGAAGDATAALAIDMRDADALYLRGLAKLKTGDTAGGNKDLADAKNVNADVAAGFEAYGINP